VAIKIVKLEGHARRSERLYREISILAVTGAYLGLISLGIGTSQYHPTFKGVAIARSTCYGDAICQWWRAI
jgi:hypothetical protein